jgi:hypothetical protein
MHKTINVPDVYTEEEAIRELEQGYNLKVVKRKYKYGQPVHGSREQIFEGEGWFVVDPDTGALHPLEVVFKMAIHQQRQMLMAEKRNRVALYAELKTIKGYISSWDILQNQ